MLGLSQPMLKDVDADRHSHTGHTLSHLRLWSLAHSILDIPLLQPHSYFFLNYLGIHRQTVISLWHFLRLTNSQYPSDGALEAGPSALS